MKQGYILRINRIDFHILASYSNVYSNKRAINESLSQIVNEKSQINGTEIENKWFPQIDAKVFISHSGKDVDYAVKYANYIKQKHGVNAFVDSQVWGYMPELISKLDNGLNSEGKCVDRKKYDKCCNHVHNMLSIALAKMIEHCDYFIFLDSPYSMDRATKMTESPWIYYELSISNMLASEGQLLNEGLRCFDSIAYKAPTKHLKMVDLNELDSMFEYDFMDPTIRRMKELIDYK